MSVHVRRLAVAVVALALPAAGCSSGSSPSASRSTALIQQSHTATSTSTTPVSSATPPSATITIKNFAFGTPITVRPGEIVTVKNADDTAHTVTAANGSFNTMPIFAGASKTFAAPEQAGSYQFHCNIHADMHGTLIVKG